MKKIFLMTFLSIFAVSAAFAQVKNVKKAYKLSEAYENPDFDCKMRLLTKLTTISSKVPNSKNCLTQKVKYRIS